jgi:(1->4)-alpha-D-glucan 1-alpha-D-glucosylmutase
MGKEFLRELEALLVSIVRPGLLGSLSQAVLKIAAPGVPDFYQGSEMWEFNLVDPDNRRPVDFDLRRRALEELDGPGSAPAARARQLLDGIEDGRLKLLVTSRGLRLRGRQEALFADGAYLPLPAAGPRRDHVVAFAREGAGSAALALAGRFFTRLSWPPVGASAWEDTAVSVVGVGGTVYRDAFTERELVARAEAGGVVLSLSDVFAYLPFALLERVS